MDFLDGLLEKYNGSDRVDREYVSFITIRQESLLSLFYELKYQLNYTHLVLITAVDYIEQEKFQITYIVHNYKTAHDIAVRIFIDRNEPVMVSVHELWKQAKTYQRELKEMFGIEFPGSPGLNDPFILEDWDGIPPYRRDFDTKKYSEETYFPRPGRTTNDPSEHMKNQLYKNDLLNEDK